MSSSSEPESTPSMILFSLGDSDIIMTTIGSAIACGESDPINLQNLN